MLTQAIAQKLDMPPEALEKASLRAFLEARRRETEAQLFLLAKKHGVQTVQEFDAAVQAGRIREEDGFEDFLVFDRLEADREKILEALQSLP
ncbi:MAG: hypothetical protein HY712_04180 [candidate division NC10 bacterium]|nr:hypothetical protein [candidate division NC10 bacterium]